jgi:hypothetical protein
MRRLHVRALKCVRGSSCFLADAAEVGHSQKPRSGIGAGQRDTRSSRQKRSSHVIFCEQMQWSSRAVSGGLDLFPVRGPIAYGRRAPPAGGQARLREQIPEKRVSRTSAVSGPPEARGCLPSGPLGPRTR